MALGAEGMVEADCCPLGPGWAVGWEAGRAAGRGLVEGLGAGEGWAAITICHKLGD